LSLLVIKKKKVYFIIIIIIIINKKMKRIREIKEKKEESEENNIRKKSKSLNIFLNRIDLCDLPIDILEAIIGRETTLLEKHILKFVCKKIHNKKHTNKF
jgi:hypothetical protein